jgi:DNA-binding transcriptional ArsR family regulator
MRLVVELDDLKRVGFAVRDHPQALDAVRSLIASSPSLTDVIGARSGEVEPVPARELLLDALADREWHTTRELTDAAQIDNSTALGHLKTLERSGLVVSRGKPRRAYEWCLA